jgi:hypothetical protein
VHLILAFLLVAGALQNSPRVRNEPTTNNYERAALDAKHKSAISKIYMLKLQEKDSKMNNDVKVKVKASAHEEKEGTFVGVRRSEREKHHHFSKLNLQNNNNNKMKKGAAEASKTAIHHLFFFCSTRTGLKTLN